MIGYVKYGAVGPREVVGVRLPEAGFAFTHTHHFFGDQRPGSGEREEPRGQRRRPGTHPS